MKTIYEFLLKAKTAVSTQDMGYVDLGLPSGLLWARCNIGADEPTEYGDYFMWGSTEPDTDKPCDWKHSPFNDGSADYDNKYFNSVQNKVCPNGILAPEYDAATVILGKDWRLPTKDDFEELINNTDNKWIKNYKGLDIKGRIFTSKNGEAAKANGAELFIPACGVRINSKFYKQGICVNCWSSSIDNIYNMHFSDAFCLKATYLLSSMVMGDDRSYGFCLRAVKGM